MCRGMPPRTGPATRDKLLDAAVSSTREKGYAATKVDELCAATGLTKGAFFHHFDSKEALALATIEHFGQRDVRGRPPSNACRPTCSRSRVRRPAHCHARRQRR